jgi:16S rRNA G1207 methylase RsmC
MTPAQIESLKRAKDGTSEANYAAIMAGFAAMGIPDDQIQPRENVFTFGAWLAQGRSVRKGQHGVKIPTVIEKRDSDERKVKFRRFTTVFHVSQTEEGTQRPQPRNLAEHEAFSLLASRPPASEFQPNHFGVPSKFRQWADDLQSDIDHARRPMTQNPTPKRNAQYQGRLHDGRNLARTQAALRALADAHDAGTVPAELAALRTRKEIAPLVRKWLESPSYYARREADDYADTTPAGRALQAMIDARPQAQQESRQTKIEQLEAQIRLSNIPGYFPTPEPLVKMMLECADIEDGMRILEPSAGSGAIADAVKAAGFSSMLGVCEINYQLHDLLALKGHFVIGRDCLEDVQAQYHRILMNPPFEKNQDIAHVRAMYDHLTDDGVLVAILSPHFEYAQDRASVDFRAWLDEVGANWMEIPAGAFKQSGTQVATRLMIIDKREQ